MRDVPRSIPGTLPIRELFPNPTACRLPDMIGRREIAIDLNRPFSIVDLVINFLLTREQFSFAKFCYQEKKEHIKIK